ncbi:MAG: S9 family peptidase [Bacteroidia bacterium]|nr:S9 family peptidase [Bacteroidia bacterium]
MRLQLVLVLNIVLTVASSSQQRPLTPVDKALFRTPATPVLSPVSNAVAYTIREADTAANRWITHVHLLDAAGNGRQLTRGAESCTAPAWSPDGALVSFLSTRAGLGANGERSKGNTALFGIPMTGGEARLLAAPEEDVLEYVWSPDGSHIAFLTMGALPDSSLAIQKRRAQRKLNLTAASDPKPGRTLWLLTVSSGQIRRIADLDGGVANFVFFPDGERLAYQTNYSGEYNDEQKHDLWVTDLSGVTTRLTDMDGPERKPRISPDGRFIAYLSQTVPDIEFAKTEISLLDMTTRQTRRVTANAIHSVADMHWLPDGSLLALFNVGTSAELHLVDPGSGALRRVTDPAIVVSEVHASRSGTAVFTAEGVASLRELYLQSRDGSTLRTRFSDQLKPFLLGKQEVITIRSDDNLFDIEAVLVTPPTMKPGTPVPLLLAYHGGPYGDFDNKFFQAYPAHILAAHGIATVMPNVRGSSGYSDAFGQANRYDLGGGDFRDAMRIVDALVTRGVADSGRMAVMGGSYGGYMTNWTISQTQRFKAAVSLFGIFSWFTDWSNSWQPVFEVMYLGYNYWEKPLDMNNLWIARAPQTYARSITTPTLILQGDKDQYTNLANSREMYQALHALGCEVEFVVYHGAGHGLRNTPNQWIDSMERSVQWIRGRIDTR